MATGGGGIGGGEGAASCYQRKGWMRDDLVKRLKHIETPSKQGATVFFSWRRGRHSLWEDFV